MTYPWVKDLSGDIATGHPRRRALAKENNQATARLQGYHD